MITEVKVTIQRWYNECASQLYNDIAELPPIIQKGIRTATGDKLNGLLSVTWDEDARYIVIRKITHGNIYRLTCAYSNLSDIVDFDNWEMEWLY